MKRYKLTNGKSSLIIKAKTRLEAEARLRGLNINLSKYQLVEL